MFRLLKNPIFIFFFLGNIISLIGFGFHLIAISWMVLEKTGSEFSLGKIMAFSTAPGLFLALFAGVIIDKVNRKWLLVNLDIFRMLVVIGFLIIMRTHGFQLQFLYPVAILMGLGNSLFWPTAQAFVQELVSEKDYFNANKLLSASYQVGSIIGAGLGGFIVHLYNPTIALWINILCYLISGILISLAPFQQKRQQSENERLLTSISKGFYFLKDKFDILTLGLTTILSDVAIWGSLSVLTITISKEIFNKGSWGYGLMEGLYGVGALASTIFVGYIVQHMGRGHSLILCYFIAGVMCFIVPLTPSIYYAAIAFLFMGLHNNSARIIVRTIFMENIPNSIMGRVQTIFGVYTRIMVVLSALFAGWIIEKQSIIKAVNFTTMHYFLALLGTLSILYFWEKSINVLKEKS